jgi:peptide-methionine (R)-S-oxide reductase
LSHSLFGWTVQAIAAKSGERRGDANQIAYSRRCDGPFGKYDVGIAVHRCIIASKPTGGAGDICWKEMGMNRRNFLYASAGMLAIAAGGSALFKLFAADSAQAETFEVTKTDAEWRKILTPDQYNILRQEGTEPPFSSPLLNEHRAGTFHCAGCDLALYSSKTKFESGTGWPSFWEALPDAVGTRSDYALVMQRTEVHCRRCGGHLGHIFDDGPPPTGMRHCIDGLALNFKAASPTAS